MHGRRRWTAAIALAASLSASEAWAGSCSFSSASSPSFGGYDVFGLSAINTTGSVTYNCTGVGAITVTLSRGGASSFFPRRMTSSTWNLAYNLYLDASHTSVWGDGAEGTSVYTDSSPPSGSNVTVTIYGRIPARQNVGVGLYSDAITATINF